jgi:hypothetical protein
MQHGFDNVVRQAVNALVVYSRRQHNRLKRPECCDRATTCLWRKITMTLAALLTYSGALFVAGTAALIATRAA